MKERIGRLEVEEKTDSDHHPVVVTIQGEKEVKRRRVRGKSREWRRVWNEKDKRCFGKK